MTELMTRQEIAKELLKPYFVDPSLCSVDEGGHCAYNGLGGRMCAFARACTPEGRKKLVECNDADNSLDDLGYDILQEKYRHIKDRFFWRDIQAAHDTLHKDTNLAFGTYEKLTGEKY